MRHTDTASIVCVQLNEQHLWVMGAYRGNQSVFPIVRFIRQRRPTVIRGHFNRSHFCHFSRHYSRQYSSHLFGHICRHTWGHYCRHFFRHLWGHFWGHHYSHTLHEHSGVYWNSICQSVRNIGHLYRHLYRHLSFSVQYLNLFAYICYLSKTELINIAYLKQGYPNNPPCLN